ncbi:SH3 domain-containing protein [Desulfurispira natronophila]|uniref:SH3-like domain-containing protein n=1 Tax=Desulfurispira natronophila TaxID=682562 RepID=A0A7W8DGW7_9BACT|nr:SH3 domain-containing protein [Desulfurispira natronophila]MBB5021782.1 SH3-like domain-containing protein [Desulfurispira natronophila]
MKRRILTVICILFLSTSPLLANTYISVVGDRVNLRAEPSTNADILWTLGRYFPLQVERKQGNWYRVEDFEGDRGWIHNSVANTSNRGVIVVRNNVNVRSGPSTYHDILFRTTYGVAFRIVKQERNWYEVEHPEGHKGWIRGDMLWGDK